MESTTINGIRIAFRVLGDKSAPTVLLIMGLGLPAAAWPQELVQYFAERGYRVILFDNRDMGGSQLFRDRPMPNIAWQFIRYKLGFNVRTVYRLDDMARDAVALLDYLDVPSAHVVGASMGGMIAQLVALDHANRVTSLTSIMSTTGARDLPQPHAKVRRKILGSRPPADDRAARVAHFRQIWQLIGSPQYPPSDEHLREFLERVMDAGIPTDGTLRQVLAIFAAPDRTERLQSLQIPTLVLHGEDDPLVPIECGRATAAAIRGSKLVTFPGMGHDLPEPLLDRMAALIDEHMRGAAQ